MVADIAGPGYFVSLATMCLAAGAGMAAHQRLHGTLRRALSLLAAVWAASAGVFAFFFAFMRMSSRPLLGVVMAVAVVAAPALAQLAAVLLLRLLNRANVPASETGEPSGSR